MLDKGTFRAQANPFAGIPEPDWGPTQTFFNSIGPSFQMSFSGTGVRAGKYFLADALDGDAITAEEFKEQYAYPGGPQWMPGMTRSRAELMVSDYLDDVMAASEVSPERNPMSAMAGGFVGQALDPINYIGPGLARAGTALAASKNFAVAGTGRAVNVLGTAINPGTRYFNAEAKLMSFAQQAKLRLAETAINGTAEALWQVGGINAFTEYTQQNYGAKDFVADLFGAPIIASAFGIGRAAWGRLSPDTRSIISDRVTRMAANGEIRPEEIKAVLATDPEGQRILAEREARLAQLESDSAAAVEQGNATPYAQPPPFVDEFGYINRVWSEVGEELARAADENTKLAAGWAGGDIPPAVLEAKIAADRAKAAFEKLQTERMGRALMGEEIGDEFDLIAKTLRESGASEPVLNKLAELGQSRPAVVDATTRRPVGLTLEQLENLSRDAVDRGDAVLLPDFNPEGRLAYPHLAESGKDVRAEANRLLDEMKMLKEQAGKLGQTNPDGSKYLPPSERAEFSRLHGEMDKLRSRVDEIRKANPELEYNAEGRFMARPSSGKGRRPTGRWKEAAISKPAFEKAMRELFADVFDRFRTKDDPLPYTITEDKNVMVAMDRWISALFEPDRGTMTPGELAVKHKELNSFRQAFEAEINAAITGKRATELKRRVKNRPPVGAAEENTVSLSDLDLPSFLTLNADGTFSVKDITTRYEPKKGMRPVYGAESSIWMEVMARSGLLEVTDRTGLKWVRKKANELIARNMAAREQLESPKLRAELLRKHAETADQKKVKGTLTADESWLSDLYQKAFGVEVRFFDENISRQVGALGFVGTRDPRTIFVRSGALFGPDADSMMTIAGHELSHSISRTSPITWLAMSDAIVAAGVNPVVRDAYARTKAALEAPGAVSLWTSMSPGQKIDEVFATVAGRATQTPEFWRAMWTTSPDDARILHGALREQAEQFKARTTEKAPKKIRDLVRQLGQAVALGQKTALEMSADTAGELIYTTIDGGARYAARHWDFLQQVNSSLRESDYQAIFGKGWENSLAAADEKISELVRIVEPKDGEVFNDQNYIIRPWTFHVDLSQDNWQTVLSYRIISQVFSVAREGTVERRIFEYWKGLTPAEQGAAHAPDVYRRYLSHPDRKGLVVVVKGENGNLRVGLLKDRIADADEPTLKELDDSLKRALRTETLNGLDEDIQTVAHSLNTLLWAMRTNPEGMPKDKLKAAVAAKERALLQGFTDPKTGALVVQDVEGVRIDGVESTLLKEFFYSDLAMDVVREWRRWQDGKIPETGHQGTFESFSHIPVRSMEDNIFDAFLSAFREFATEKANDALVRSDLKEFQSIRDLSNDIDVLQHHREVPDAWRDVLERWKETPELQAKLEAFEKARETLTEGWARFRKEVSAEQRSRISMSPDEMLRETDPKRFEANTKAIREAVTTDLKEGVILRWLAAKSDTVDLMAKPDIEAVWKEIVSANPKMEKLLADMVQDRLEASIPGFSRAEALNEYHVNKNAESYEVNEWRKGEANDPDPMLQRVDSDSGLPSEADLDAEGTYMARLADEAPEAAAARALETAVKDEQQQATTLRRLSQTAAESLKRDREYFGGWNKSYAAKASSHITSLAESFGIAGFKLDAGYAKLREQYAKEPPKLNDRTQPVFEALMEMVKLHESRTASLIKLAKFGKITKSAPGEVNDLLIRNYRRLENFEQAVAATNDDLIRQSGSTIITILRDTQAKEGLFGLARNGFAHVKNFLDGLAYKGTRMRTDSVAMHRIVSRERAQGRLVTLLEEINQEIPGFRDQWLNNQHTRNLELHRQGAYTGPDHVKKVYDRILQRLDEVNEALAGEANSLGANIRLLDGYIWSQTHRADLIRTAGRVAFIRDLGSMVDVAKMQKHHGPDWSFQSWAEQFYHEVTDPAVALRNSYDPDQVGNNLADPNGRHRTIFFKPGSAFDYDMKYGSRHTASAITAQLGMRAEKLGLMQMMGTNYDKNWGEFLATLGGVGPKFHDMWVADLTYRQIAGQLDHPYDAKLAAYGRAVRNWMNSAVGWMAGIASLPDMGNLASQLRFMGGPDALRHRSVLDAMMKNGSSQGERTMWLRGNGAGLTALVQSYSRILDADGWFVNTAEKLSNLTFKYNGLEVMNRAVQGAYFDISTQILGDNVKAQTPAFKNWLAQSGISEGEWTQMAKHADKVDGLENVRLSPEMIPDTALSRKLAMAMRAGMDYALIQPSSSTEALLRMGTQSGTWTGEALRTVMQFKSYPVDMVRRIVRRFNNGYAQNALTERMIWASTMVGLSVAALSLKDMARGNEPMNPFDGDQWNWHNVLRVAEQATVGPFAMMGQFSNMQQAAGPALGGVLDVATSDTAYGRTSAAFDLTPFSTAWTGPRRALMATVMPETFGEPIQAMYDWRRITTGQGRLFTSD